jgi:hypothetical protein
LNLSYFGFFALGTFVSGIIIVGLRSVKNDPGAYVQVSASTAFSAFVGGALFPLISLFREQSAQAAGQGLFMYPVGLAVAMLWFFAEDARVNIKNGGTDRLLGLINFAFVIGISLLAAYILFTLSFAPVKPS